MLLLSFLMMSTGGQAKPAIMEWTEKHLFLIPNIIVPDFCMNMSMMQQDTKKLRNIWG